MPSYEIMDPFRINLQSSFSGLEGDALLHIFAISKGIFSR